MILKETIYPKGTPVIVPAVQINGKTFIISGKFIKTACLKNEWQEDIDDPEEVIRALKKSGARVDLLRFWQRIPETEPKFPYYKEWRQVAAIPISDFKHWWDKQVNPNTRRLVRKVEKLGVTIKETQLDDALVRGIMGIFNESPIRRGKPFRHYGKDFETVKREMSADLAESIFIAAYDREELVGFIKLLVADRYAMVTMILDKKSHRDKTPVNGMLANAVRICADRHIPFLTYLLWRRAGHAYFQERNGFQKIPVPEIYVPLTSKGRLALSLRLHKGVKGILPDFVKVWLLNLGAKWYSRKLGRKAELSPKAGAPSALSPS